MNETDLKDIKRRLKVKFDLRSEIKGNKLYFDEFNGYIRNDDKYIEVQELCESICDLIEEEYECSCDYSLLDEGYEFSIEIF